jgi:hypothetical protein
VIAPELTIGDEIDEAIVKAEIIAALAQMNLADPDQPVALAVPWQGSASFARLQGFARAVLGGLETGHWAWAPADTRLSAVILRVCWEFIFELKKALLAQSFRLTELRCQILISLILVTL